jgi:hypothetical protein
MFHGCRSQDNEAKILANGFQVSQCVSGGANFGTWFAYNAAYSDGGFVHTDCDGVKHLFLSIVSEKDVARDDKICMRVVAQDCAYPAWLLTYRDIYDVCPGNCMQYCGSDYDDYDDDYWEVYYEDFYEDDLCGNLLWKTLREARIATRALRRRPKSRTMCHAKRSCLGCVTPEAQTKRKVQPSKRGGRHKVSVLESFW